MNIVFSSLAPFINEYDVRKIYHSQKVIKLTREVSKNIMLYTVKTLLQT